MIVVINGALCGLAAYLLSGDALRLNPFIVVGRGVGDRTPGTRAVTARALPPM